MNRARLILARMRTHLGRGSYRYLLDGREQGIREWFETQSTESGVVVRGVREAETLGTRIRVAATARGVDEWFRETSVTFERRDAATVSVRFVATDRRLLWDREIGTRRAEGGSATRTAGEVALPKDALLYPLLRCFLGPIIVAVSDRHRRSVVVPWILDPSRDDLLLAPLVEERQARVVGAEGTVRRFEFLSGQYDRESSFFLDQQDRVVRYTFPQPGAGTWTVEFDPRAAEARF